MNFARKSDHDTVPSNDNGPPNDHEANITAPLTLVVGDVHAWAKNNNDLPQIAGFKFIDVDALDAETLIAFPAKIVLSTLTTRDRDATEIATMLSALSFQGRYRVIADSLPNPDLIMQEVAAVAPEIDFDVLNLPGDLSLG